jgi:hypothetical protein
MPDETPSAKEARLAKLVEDMRARQALKDARRAKKEARVVAYKKKFRAKQLVLIRKAKAKRAASMQPVDPAPFRLPPPANGLDVLPDPEKEPEMPVRWNPDRVDNIFQSRRAPKNADPFMEKIAQQPGFVEAMQENIKDPRVAKFIKKCGELQNKSLTFIAKSCGLTTSDLARIWRDDRLSRAFFEIVNRMPENAKKVMDDSLGDRKTCPRCDGMKFIEVPDKFREFFFEPGSNETMAMCPECRGEGFKITVGNANATQMIWEKVGWTKQKGGIQVNVNMSDHSVDSVIDDIVDDFEPQTQIVEHEA